MTITAPARSVILPAFREGVVFGMSAEDYHKVRALSASGVKQLLVSPMDFWARHWSETPPDEDDKDWAVIGDAYHTRIVEGVETFRRRYAAHLDKADYPNALVTMDEIRAELKARGLKVGGNKDELIERLLESDPNYEVWDRIEAQHRAANEGRTFLSRDLIGRIEIAAAMIEKNPVLSQAFRGGVPEVSIFWRDADTGCPKKARIDYLKPKAIVDLKTFANQRGKPLDRAIAFAIAEHKYYIQAAHYYDAADQIAGLVKRGLVSGEAPPGFVDAVSANDERTFLFVFQQKGIAPVARGKIMARNIGSISVGQSIIADATRRFLDCLERFGDDPWIDDAPVSAIDDSELPAFAFD